MKLNKTLSAAILAGSLGMALTQPVKAQDSLQDLKKLIAEQQKQLDLLKQKMKQQEQRLNSTAEVVEQQQDKSSASNTQIGGYGELHYNNPSNGDDKLDFHRFVLFFGHRFNDKLRFFSELELEHAFNADGEPGEVELEQAYIEYDLNQNVTNRTGVFLIPVGILNETHEPNTFYGVERNPVEKNIIPTTWWEGGTSLHSRFGKGWSLDTAVTGGLNVPTTGSNAFLIRKGRTKVAEATANNLAFTGRIKYTGIAGLELAASYQYQDDITQGQMGVSANLLSGHLIYQKEQFTLKALYAQWNLSGSAAKANGRDQQQGFYIEPSYKINDTLGLFARYNQWDNEAGNNLVDSKKKQTSFGFNYWLHPQVVFKADFENYGGALDGHGFNLGMGYQF